MKKISLPVLICLSAALAFSIRALVLAGDVLFVGGTNIVVAYSIANGDELWSRVVKGRVRGLAAAGGRLFVSTDTGSIHMFGRAH